MAEYYAVLSKAVASLELSSVEARRAVYDKARNALIGQLKAIDPPLPTSEISRQRLELEEAIRKVERESAEHAPAAAAARAESPPVAVPPEQEPFRRQIKEAESRGAGEPPPRREPPPVAPRAAPAEPGEDEESGEGARERADRVTPPAAPAFAASRGYRDRDMPQSEPRLAPEYGWEAEPAAPTAPPRYTGPAYDEPGERPSAARGRRRPDDGVEAMGRRARPSRLPMVLLLLLIVVMAGGLAALGWSQREILMDLIASFDSGSSQPAPPSATATNATDDTASQPTKNPDRLLSPGETAQTGVRVVDVGPQAQAPDAGADQGSGSAETQVATAPPAATATQPPDEPTVGVGAAGPQKAVLYEEPLDSAAAANGVVAINGSVSWAYVPDSPDGPEITGNVDVPDRQMNVKLTIRRNTDSTLPASHLVEVVVDVPTDFPGKAIKSVPRLILKGSEAAQRGQPLIGATATITEGFFWIALSAVDADVKANLALLRDNGWIDLPLVYETGQRAILTIEKGTLGDKVFKQALAAWSGNQESSAEPLQGVLQSPQ
jgi:hypothetical protein